MCCTSTPLCTLTVWCLMNHGDSFTLREVFSGEWVVLLTTETVVWAIGSGLPFKIIFLFTGTSDRMLLQVMKNDHVVVAHCRCGPMWLQSEEEIGEDHSLGGCNRVQCGSVQSLLVGPLPWSTALMERKVSVEPDCALTVIWQLLDRDKNRTWPWPDLDSAAA
jgi:hypothetical protein